jgi:hypothetical protein
MLYFNEEKEKLTQDLSVQYSKNIIDMEEYERILEYINKIETKKELIIIEKIIYENNISNNELTVNKIMVPETKEKYLSMFSWRTSNLKSLNGNGGKYISLFGSNRIIVDNLPNGRTVLNVNSIFGLTEIIISKKVKIINKTIPIFAGIFAPIKINKEEDLPELYIIGKAIFGNITIKIVDEYKHEVEFGNKLKEKIMQRIYDKM